MPNFFRSTLLLICFPVLAVAQDITSDEVGVILRKQFGVQFDVVNVKPSYIVRKIQADGYEDLVMLVSIAKGADSKSPLPQGVEVFNPFPSKEYQSSYWADFVSGDFNAIAIIHADDCGRFDSEASKKYLLLGPSAMSLSSPKITGDEMMRAGVYQLKDGGKVKEIPSIEFATTLDKGWVYWFKGAYHWDESDVYD